MDIEKFQEEYCYNCPYYYEQLDEDGCSYGEEYVSHRESRACEWIIHQ